MLLDVDGMDPTLSPYDGDPLGPSEIRILSVKAAPEQHLLRHVFPWLQTDTTLSLVTRRHLLDQGQAYDAVSYVWGTAAASVPVKCNGAPMLITQNAFDMLQHLRERPLWVDQISINQADADEKAAQIALMQHIYANADLVIVWLGTSIPAAELFAKQLPVIADIAPRWIEGEPLLETEYWPKDNDPVWTGLYYLLDNTWFRRLWTYQEIVLARRATLTMASDTHVITRIDAESFLKFVMRGMFMVDGDPTGKCYLRYNQIAANSLPNEPTQKRLAFRACDTIIRGRNSRLRNNNLAVTLMEMPILMGDLRTLDVKEPVDRVWAITGLLSKDVQEILTPFADYSEKGKIEYWRAYIPFGRAIFNEGLALNLLEFPPSATRSDHLPSWCPDFSQDSTFRMHLSSDWNRRIPYTEGSFDLLSAPNDSDKIDDRGSLNRSTAIVSDSRANFWVNGSDSRLRANGHPLDTVTKIVSSGHTLDNAAPQTSRAMCEWLLTDPMRSAIMHFHESSLDLARQVCTTSDPGPHNIPAEFLMAFFADCRITDTTGRFYHEAWMCLTAGGIKYWSSLDEETRIGVWPYFSRFWRLVGLTFFATRNRRFGLAEAGCAPGDQVCTFYGGEPLYILRAKGTEAEPARFVGVAFVPHLMEQYQRDAARCEDDRIFVVA